MKYFTPELLERLQDMRDEAAVEQWERAARDYASSLKENLAQFPAPLRRLTNEFRLHDAEVLSVTRAGDTLSITLRPELSGSLLILSYTLVKSPFISRSALPQEHRTEYVSWLYDELAVERVPGPPSWLTAADRERGDDRVTVYTHSILLSNGWELRLTFRKFKLSRPETLIPPAPPTDDGQAEVLTRSAS